MTEVWFYHLEHRPLEAVLPVLLERALARGWRSVVQATSSERVEALDGTLWTYSDESFLPHGSARDGDPDLQPIWLTTDEMNPNHAQMRVFVDGADAPAALAGASGLERAVIVFDGRDQEALATARAQFRALREMGHSLSYWRQNPQGRWEQQA